LSSSPEAATRAQLLQLRALGTARLAAARRGDWQALAGLEAERREALALLTPAALSALAEADPQAFTALQGDLAEQDRLVASALRGALARREAALAGDRARERAERGYLKASRSSS
jgi:hypothetical protein